jgi:hypothetical protein
MEPRIQYAQTADGVSIAFWTMGKGMTLVHMAHPFTHIQMEWQFPEMRRRHGRLAEKRKLIRFDVRGLWAIAARSALLIAGHPGAGRGGGGGLRARFFQEGAVRR